MAGYLLSPRAQADLEEIWTYSEGQWDADRATSYLRQVQHAVETLAWDPRRGRACSDIRTGYFKFNVGSHVIFYRKAAENIDAVRILHQRMDFDRHL